MIENILKFFGVKKEKINDILGFIAMLIFLAPFVALYIFSYVIIDYSVGRFYTSKHIICYSGGKIIFDSYSYGYIEKSIFGKSLTFHRKSDRKKFTIVGNCIVK